MGGTQTALITGTGKVSFGDAGLSDASLASTGTGDVNLCWTTAGVFTQGAACGTSLAKYKTNVSNLQHGLDYLMQLRPVTFDWKATGQHDMGLIADETAAVDPLLGAYAKDGSLYNFKDRAVLAVLIKAVQEQQREIEILKSKIETLENR